MRIFTLVFIAIPFLILGQPSSCDSLPMFFNQIFPDSLDDIDSFCIELHSGNDYPYKGQNWPGCPNRWKLDNPFWYTFIAGGTDVTINIESSDCRYNAGSQVSIYELPKHIVYHPDSTGINPEILDANLVNDCILPACTTNPRNFSFSTTPCKYYGIVFDGCNGDACHLKVRLETSGEIIPIDTFTIDSIYSSIDIIGKLSDTLCVGATGVPFYIQAIPNANRALWKLNDSLIFDKPIRSKVYLNFPDTGNYELCVAAANECETTDYTCKLIHVSELEADTIYTTDTVCEEGYFAWIDQYDRVIKYFRLSDSGMLEYDTFSIDQHLCKVPLRLNLWVKNENDEAPIQIDTLMCHEDLPLTIGNKRFYRSYSNYSFTTADTTTGCDRHYNLNLKIFGGDIDLESDCDGQNNVMFRFNKNSIAYLNDWKEQFEFIASDSAYSYSVDWLIDSHKVMSGDNLDLTLPDYVIDSLAEADTANIELQIHIYKDSLLLCSSSSNYIYHIDSMLPLINRNIKVVDNSFLVAEDSTAYYHWMHCDSNLSFIPAAYNQLYYPRKDGYYAVYLWKGKCEVMSECVFFSSTTNSSNQFQSPLKIVPNPNNGQFKLEFDHNSILGEPYAIYSLTGNLLSSGLLQDQMIFDLSAYPSGIYLLRIKNKVLRIVKIY